MKVKKYIALNMQEAMKKIRSELGNDAVILNSKVIYTGGFIGLFTKKKIEVIAAMDPDVPSRPLTQKQELPREKRTPLQNLEGQITGQSNLLVNQPVLLNELKELKGLIQSITANEQENFYPEPIKRIHEQLIQKGVSALIRGIVTAELLERWYCSNGNLANEEVEKNLKEILVNQIQQLAFTGISYKKKSLM
ncbi:hypothetical protein ACFFIX_07585 [Metabacillus herbersteinensis]|uniref:Uncharacterized protein n=1 Tax=Metabacillus herbersteinensis TaxID=283816 RepID=A0ABV6GCB4_9BACI